MSSIRIAQGCLVVEHNGAIIGCVEKGRHNESWSFCPVEGNPYTVEHAERGNGTLESALAAALSYRPFS